MSPASFATSVPLPIAKPTSAFFKAGESFTPSPVMPTTKSSSCARRTRRLLSDGRARATTRRDGSAAFTSSSLIAPSSVEVHTTSEGSVRSPASRAMAMAVSFLSPVTITTWIPAERTSLIAVTASARTLSRIASTQTRVHSPSSVPPSTRATDKRRIERDA